MAAVATQPLAHTGICRGMLHHLYLLELQSHIPSWYNAIRLAVCLSALIVGIIGGATYSRLTRTHQVRGREVIEAEP